jgi:DNA-binding XRE family transcriptional regulator
MTLKKLLIETRKDLNLTQKQLAELLELDELTVKFLEYGEPLWDATQLQKKARKIIHEAKNRNLDALDPT